MEAPDLPRIAEYRFRAKRPDAPLRVMFWIGAVFQREAPAAKVRPLHADALISVPRLAA